MTSTQPCGVDDCARPTPTRICARHTDQLADDLAAVPDLIDDLDAAVARQTASGPRYGGRSAEKPLPYDQRASLAQDALTTTLRAWLIALHPGAVPGPAHTRPRCDHGSCMQIRWRAWPGDDATGAATWLRDRVGLIARSDAAPDVVDEIHAAVDQARHDTDRAADRLFAGPCDTCGDVLWARLNATVATCRTCEAAYDLADRRAWLLAAADDELVTAIDASRALTRLGLEVTPERIRQWAHRGRLTPQGTETRAGRQLPLYRLGDLTQLLDQTGGTAA